MNLRARLTEWWEVKRGWRIQLHSYAGPWASLGIHVDLAPQVDLHLGWLMIRAGRLRDCERGNGFIWPRTPRRPTEG